MSHLHLSPGYEEADVSKVRPSSIIDQNTKSLDNKDIDREEGGDMKKKRSRRRDESMKWSRSERIVSVKLMLSLEASKL